MRLARSVFALVAYSAFCLTTAAPAAADASGALPSGMFELSLVETVKEHSHREKIREVCQVGFRVRGCTDFPKEELSCHCEEREGSWFLNGHAYLEAVIHLSSGQPIGDVLIHERAHIGDLERGLREHFNSIMSIRFSSQNSCKTHAPPP